MKALITGASSGIGRDIARSLARRGYDLILVARREDRLCELAASLPVEVRVIPMDLTSAERCRALYDQVREESIHVLVNNAGRGLFGPFDETDLDEELAMLDLNIRATHILTKLFLPDFKARNSGHILNVASSAAFLPGPLLSSYYASKAYVLRLSQAIYEELRQSKSAVKISVLCPGPVHTEFNQVADVRFSTPGLSSPYVADYAVRGMLAGKLLLIPGATMKATRLGSRFLPDKLLARLCFHVQHRKNRGPDGPATPK